jgi:hypothetical protein
LDACSLGPRHDVCDECAVASAPPRWVPVRFPAEIAFVTYLSHMTEAVLVFAAVFAVPAAAPGADTMLLFGQALAGGARSAVPVAVGITAGKSVLPAL